MKANVGAADRTVRILLGVALISFGILTQTWWGALGLIPLATGSLSWCPPYAILGISSCNKS